MRGVDAGSWKDGQGPNEPEARKSQGETGGVSHKHISLSQLPGAWSKDGRREFNVECGAMGVDWKISMESLPVENGLATGPISSDEEKGLFKSKIYRQQQGNAEQILAKTSPAVRPPASPSQRTKEKGQDKIHTAGGGGSNSVGQSLESLSPGQRQAYEQLQKLLAKHEQVTSDMCLCCARACGLRS
jgi:hypothetical protein